MGLRTDPREGVVTEFEVFTEHELREHDLLAAFPGDDIQGRLSNDGPYISPSQVKMVMRCPEQFRRRYVLGEKQRPAGAMLWGSADHYAVEQHFTKQLADGEGHTTTEVQALFAANLDERVEQDGLTEIEWDKDQPNLTANDALKHVAEIKDKGTALVGVYRERVAPLITPLTVEEPFELHLAAVPVPVRGKIDLTAHVGGSRLDMAGVDGKPITTGGEQRIIDRKTAGRRGIQPEWHVQGRIYQLHKPLPVEYQLSLKTKVPDVVAFDTDYTFPVGNRRMVEAQLRRAVALVAHCYLTYGPDEPWPDAMTHPYACSFCGFRPSCPWWSDGSWS